jgi:hypothetical protein
MNMLRTERYLDQQARWPEQGRHILASFDEKSVIVYQAYRSSIGRFAVEHGFLGGEFSYSRMSWIKPNFLWMMYRSGWGTKPDQEVTLALRVRRDFFERVLSEAVQSSYSDAFPTREAWASAVAASSVRLQWDPDHDPTGRPVERRALQLGLRGGMLEELGKHQLLEVVDMSTFVAEQRAHACMERLPELVTPVEDVYHPRAQETSARLGL